MQLKELVSTQASLHRYGAACILLGLSSYDAAVAEVGCDAHAKWEGRGSWSAVSKGSSTLELRAQIDSLSQPLSGLEGEGLINNCDRWVPFKY